MIVWFCLGVVVWKIGNFCIFVNVFGIGGNDYDF